MTCEWRTGQTLKIQTVGRIGQIALLNHRVGLPFFYKWWDFHSAGYLTCSYRWTRPHWTALPWCTGVLEAPLRCGWPYRQQWGVVCFMGLNGVFPSKGIYIMPYQFFFFFAQITNVKKLISLMLYSFNSSQYMSSIKEFNFQAPQPHPSPNDIMTSKQCVYFISAREVTTDFLIRRCKLSCGKTQQSHKTVIRYNFSKNRAEISKESGAQATGLGKHLISLPPVKKVSAISRNGKLKFCVCLLIN